MKQKILLLNPPGKENYIRDYYCSKVSKASYVSPPIVLLFLSGILSKNYDIEVVDAIAQKIDYQRCEKMIMDKDIFAIIFLTGAVCWKEDFSFLKQIKEKKQIKMIANGDIFLENPEERLKKNEFLDAIILNFATIDILEYLEGSKDSIDNMVYRKDGQIIRGESVSPKYEFSIPIPRHEAFPLSKYRFPFSLNHPMSVVLTDYGCPFRCSFCVINKLNFCLRRVDNVIDELFYLSNIGVKEIFFIDQTFGIVKKRTLDLCNAMITNNFCFSWSCFSRADVLDEEVLIVMKKSGCHTIIFGVESGSQRILDIYDKNINKEQIKYTFSLCRKLKIRTAATFILGLPKEREEDCLKTIEFAKELDCDFAAFNIAIPRLGTDLRDIAIEEKIISADLDTMDQSGTYAAMDTFELSKEKILQLKNRAIREFYLRPLYLLRRILDIRSYWDMHVQICEGLGLIKRLFK